MDGAPKYGGSYLIWREFLNMDGRREFLHIEGVPTYGGSS